jgi:hypothetical protein
MPAKRQAVAIDLAELASSRKLMGRCANNAFQRKSQRGSLCFIVLASVFPVAAVIFRWGV